MESTPLDERKALTRKTMNVLDSWRLGSDEIRQILALPETVRGRSINKYRLHESFPDDPVVELRAGYLLRIGQALQTTYPTNAAMGARWMRQRHRRLGCVPLARMMESGPGGLERVLAELDCAFGWEITDAQVKGTE
mgnify:CR=1 FL=1